MDNQTPTVPRRRDLRKAKTPDQVKREPIERPQPDGDSALPSRRSLRREDPRTAKELFYGMAKAAQESAQERRRRRTTIVGGTNIFKLKETEGMSALDPQLRDVVNAKLSELRRPVDVGKRKRGIHKFPALPMPAKKSTQESASLVGKIWDKVVNEFLEIPDNATDNHPLTAKVVRRWEPIGMRATLTNWDDNHRARSARTAAIHYMKSWEEGSLNTPLNVRIDMLQSLEKMVKQADRLVGRTSGNWGAEFASAVMRRDAITELRKSEVAIDNATQKGLLYRYEVLFDSAHAVEKTKSLTPTGFFSDW